MKFYDKVNITCISGKGGDGATSARREAGVPHGGPNGGNGGHGGSVILQADRNYNTLLHLKFAKEWVARYGEPGESADKYGKSADDLIIPLPLGSLIRLIDGEHNQIIYHFTKDQEQFVVCKGGIGGAGNMHFKNSLVQYPDFSLEGEPGQKKDIEIELQLLADVGLIGMPSVGKSSIINSISNSKAKVAEYHFTTLVPNLGSVSFQDATWNVIDIPGLVEGASEGKGLGNEFLRHILKARLFCFVLDISRRDQGIQEFGSLWHEIINYIMSRFQESFEFGYEITQVSCDLVVQDGVILLNIKDQHGNLLLQKGLCWIINKIDEAQDKEIIQEYTNQLCDHIIDTLGNADGKLNKKLMLDQIITYSTILDEYKPALLAFMKDKLALVQEYSMSYGDVDYEKQKDKREVECLGEITDPDVQEILYDLGYHPEAWGVNPIDLEDDEDEEQQEPTIRKLRKISDREVARLSYQLPWGKVLAEGWFWRVMKQQGLRKRLQKTGVKTGDLLWVVGDYDSNKHIVFPYALE